MKELSECLDLDKTRDFIHRLKIWNHFIQRVANGTPLCEGSAEDPTSSYLKVIGTLYPQPATV